MGREVWRMRKGFLWPLNKTWWGYLLDPVPCGVCLGKKKGCIACEGEGKVWPKVEPPGYQVDALPSYFRHEDIVTDYGWQMWEDVSEGSPISPVCDSPEALARWLTDNGASAFGSMTATYEEWLATITRGSAPSAVISGNRLESGVSALAKTR